MSHRTTIIVAALLMAAATSVSAWTPATIERVSVGPNGVEGNNDSLFPAISAHGRFVAFESDAANLEPNDTNGSSDVFVRDRQTGRTTRVSVGAGGAQGNAGSIGAGISADGRYVTFDSNATNLVPGDTNDLGDVFVHDRQTSRTTRVSVTARGAQAAGGNSANPAISADGQHVAFNSHAANLARRDTNAAFDIFVATRR
jgi:Tol biopolymer transport system component